MAAPRTAVHHGMLGVGRPERRRGLWEGSPSLPQTIGKDSRGSEQGRHDCRVWERSECGVRQAGRVLQLTGDREKQSGIGDGGRGSGEGL